MAYFQRLSCCLLLCLCSGVGASIPAVSGTDYGTKNFVTGGVTWGYASYSAACAVVPANGTAWSSLYRYVAVSLSGSACTVATYSKSDGSFVANTTYTMGSRVASICPSDSTLSGSVCTCNSGFLERDGACVSQAGLDDDLCTNAARLSLLAPKEDYDLPGSVGDQTLCLPSSGLSSGKGCKSAFSVSAKYSKPDGTQVTNGELAPASGTGSSCVLPTTPATPTPNSCKDGQPGQVNGVTVCIPYPTGTTTETTTKSGSTGTDASGQGKVVDQTSTTVCSGGSCNTTTTTNTTVGGSTVTTTTTESQSKGAFCTANPKDKQCGNVGDGGSGFGGKCGAVPPACSGDAVMCAIAIATFKTECALQRPQDSLALIAYDDAAARDQGDQTKDITTSVTINSSKFDQSDALGVAGGLQDMAIDIAGKAVVIPWSVVGDKLHIVGLIMQAVTFLLCARIVMRG